MLTLIIKWCLMLFLLFNALFARLPAQFSDLAGLLPSEIDGWHPITQDQSYQRSNLYEYIDGGAELYLSYGFKTVLNRIYSKPGQPDMIVDIFDMGDSRDAFGLFMHSRESIDTLVGQGSEYSSGMLNFWKDRYFISILGGSEKEDVGDVIFNIAKHIEQAISLQGALPEALNFLPQENLIKESVRYFRHHAWLNSYYFIADQNILHINDSTQAVFAKYGADPARRPLLLLVLYSNQQNAQAAFRNFTTHYLPEMAESAVVKIEDGSWTGCQQFGALIGIVFKSPDEATARSLLKNIKKPEK